jgi:pseudaminic acid synthase
MPVSHWMKKNLKSMVDAVRNAEKSIGTIDYNLTEKQKYSRSFSRSLYAVKDIKKGESFSEEKC